MTGLSFVSGKGLNGYRLHKPNSSNKSASILTESRSIYYCVRRLGDRLAVGLRTLTPPTLVRIQVPQPFKHREKSKEAREMKRLAEITFLFSLASFLRSHVHNALRENG